MLPLMYSGRNADLNPAWQAFLVLQHVLVVKALDVWRSSPTAVHALGSSVLDTPFLIGNIARW